jgi:hypothetical protein
MNREVVEDHMDRFASMRGHRFIQNLNEGLAGVARRATAEDLPAVHLLGVCPRFSIRGSRGGSFVINAVNGTTDLSWELLPGKLWHRKVVSVGRFHNPFHQERACYP